MLENESAKRPETPQSHQLSRDDVLVQLDRVLSGQAVRQSPRLQAFLRFIVEETLAGRAEALNEYSIALDVFNRDESFDPKISSIVRVEASRLRTKLDNYNAIEGSGDPIRIVLPAGSYVPVFQAINLKAVERSSGALLPSMSRAWLRPGQMVAILTTAIALIAGASMILFDSRLLKSGNDTALKASHDAQAPSLVILPLRNLSADPDQDYFSDGMTDALISSLAKQKIGRIISMTSAMSYKDVDRPVTDIARELSVSHVVEGSVLQIGDKVRITAQLIEAATDRHLWAETYDRDVADVIALQNEIVDHIVSSLVGHVGSRQGVAEQEQAEIAPAAYEAHLKGRFFRNKMTKDGFRQGVEYFKQAVEQAPDYAPAYSGIATCYCLLGGHGFELVRPSEGMRAAKEAVLEALRLDDSLPEPHAFLGVIRLKYEWDWQGAEAAFRRAIDLSPSYAQAHIFYSFYLEAMGQQKAAVREAERAKTLDPLSLSANINLGWQYLQAEQLERAKGVFDATAELDPHFWGVHWGRGHYYQRKGEYHDAIEAFQKAVDTGGGHAMPLSGLGYAYAMAGQPQEAKAVLEKLKHLSEDSFVSPSNMATIYAGLGETEEAFVWLEKAFAERSRSIVWLKVTREYESLQSDPRFEALIQRVGLPD